MGSELEGRKKILMAYGAYAAAVRRDDEKSRALAQRRPEILYDWYYKLYTKNRVIH